MASVEAQQKGVQDAVSMSSPPSSPISGARRAASRKIDKGVHVQQNSESESPVLHSCVLRLRVEDRLLAEDVRESLESSKDRFVASQLITSQMENLFICTTPRPAASPSPLGTNTRSSAGHTSMVWETTRLLNRAWNLPSTAPFHLPKNTVTSILQH
ncbi:hypothetical protein CY35_01G068900 [Sphagnum magellanicum]|jgi:hypothetical protein|nr:hypothetical protein CY35_01G068900 [Sphagnum magellanicum]